MDNEKSIDTKLTNKKWIVPGFINNKSIDTKSTNKQCYGKSHH